MRCVKAAGIGEYGLRMGRIRKSADGAQVESLRNDPDPVAVDVGRIARQRLFDRNREIVELPRPSLQIEEVGGKHGARHVAPERRIAELGDRSRPTAAPRCAASRGTRPNGPLRDRRSTAPHRTDRSVPTNARIGRGRTWPATRDSRNRARRAARISAAGCGFSGCVVPSACLSPVRAGWTSRRFAVRRPSADCGGRSRG